MIAQTVNIFDNILTMETISAFTYAAITDEIRNKFREDIEACILRTRVIGTFYMSTFSPEIRTIHDQYVEAHNKNCQIKQARVFQLASIIDRYISTCKQKYSHNFYKHDASPDDDMLEGLTQKIIGEVPINLEYLSMRELVQTHLALTQLRNAARFRSDDVSIFYTIIESVYVDNKLHHPWKLLLRLHLVVCVCIPVVLLGIFFVSVFFFWQCMIAALVLFLFAVGCLCINEIGTNTLKKNILDQVATNINMEEYAINV